MIGLSKSKMKILGKHIAFLEIEHQLTVPFSFESQQTSNITDATKEEVNQKRNAIEKAIVDQFSLDKKIHLDYNSVVIGYWKDYVEIELESCPLSRNQGPLIPGLDDRIKYGYGIRWGHIRDLSEKGPPKCGKWSPSEKPNNEIFPDYIFEPFDHGRKMIGPYSDISDMAIMYTCDMSKCAIKCPCKICMSKRKDCRRKCGYEPCQVCILQCPQHKLELDRKFCHSQHAFTLKVNTDDRIRYVVKHAGIPRDCEDCASDLKDHRMFHRVFHGFCKYCRQLLIPFKFGNVSSYKSYVTAKKAAEKDFDRTCATCTKVFADGYNRKRHETTVHENLGKFECDECKSRFANTEDLDYHKGANHSEPVAEVKCVECDQVFKSKIALKKHNSRKHASASAPKVFACAECDATFSARHNLLRHDKEKHLKFKVNLNLIQFGEELLSQCDLCENRFRRKENMETHKRLVHKLGVTEVSDGQRCLFCSKIFATNSSCKRHQKQCILKDKQSEKHSDGIKDDQCD